MLALSEEVKEGRTALEMKHKNGEWKGNTDLTPYLPFTQEAHSTGFYLLVGIKVISDQLHFHKDLEIELNQNNYASCSKFSSLAIIKRPKKTYIQRINI